MYNGLMSAFLVSGVGGWCLKKDCVCPYSVMGSKRSCTVSKMLSGLVRLISFLWDGSLHSEIVSKNRSLHNTAVSSRRYFLSR